ncbi:MAG TPA: hypothetical protein VJ933_01150 [Phaeodactylibacter sp.]|nr:hypothetical protein [Phaeodactylibacter sp.]
MNRQLRASLPILLLGVLLLNSCSISGDDPIIVPFVEDEFYAELWEDFSPQGRQIVLRLRTIEEVECENATIEYKFSRQGDNEQVLSIESIVLPDDCEEGSAPARSAISLGTLENGSYPLTLSLRDAVSADGRILISDEQMRLFIADGAGVKPLRAATRRIPNSTFWGYFDTGGDEAQVALAEGFLAELQAITQPQTIESGHYGYFSINSGTSLRWEEGTAADNESRLAFQFRIPDAEGVADIQSILADYRNTYGDTIAIAVYTTMGEEW